MRVSRLLGAITAALAAAFALGVVGAAPASAHASAGQDATDWRSAVTGIEPATDAVSARTTDLGQHLEITVARGHRVVVLGYRAEPYLRVDERGVWQNDRSPAVWLNQATTPTGSMPRRFDADAPPEWRRIDAGPTVRWHDHRVHHTSGGASGPWAVAIVVDERPTTIAGELLAVPGPNGAIVTVAIAGAAFLVIVAIGALGARRGGLLVGIVGTALAVGNGFQVVGQWAASTDTVGSRIGAAVYGVLAGLAALVAAASAVRRGTERAAPALLLGGVAIAVSGGFAHVTWLVHSQLPTTLPAPVARFLVAAQLAIGVAFAAVGAVAAARRPTPRPEVVDGSALGG